MATSEWCFDFTARAPLSFASVKVKSENQGHYNGSDRSSSLLKLGLFAGQKRDSVRRRWGRVDMSSRNAAGIDGMASHRRWSSSTAKEYQVSQ
jgi:hypothetical protein